MDGEVCTGMYHHTYSRETWNIYRAHCRIRLSMKVKDRGVGGAQGHFSCDKVMIKSTVFRWSTNLDGRKLLLLFSSSRLPPSAVSRRLHQTETGTQRGYTPSGEHGSVPAANFIPQSVIPSHPIRSAGWNSPQNSLNSWMLNKGF